MGGSECQQIRQLGYVANPADRILINSTDTVSGAKTLLSTLTVLGASNFYVMVTSGDSNNVFGTTITIPAQVAVSSQSCYVDAVGFTAFAVNIDGYFNGDGSASYTTSQRVTTVNGTGSAGSGSPRGYFPTMYDGDVVGSNPPVANTPYRFRLSFETAPYTKNLVMYQSTGQLTSGACPSCVSGAESVIQGQYTGGAPVTKINFVTNSIPVVNPALNNWQIIMHWELWCKGFHYSF